MAYRTIVITVLAGALLASGCGAAASGAAPSPGPSETPGVRGGTAEARLEPVRYVELSPAGEASVSGLSAAEGDEVQAGQVLLNLQTALAPKAPPPECTRVPIRIPHRMWNLRRPPFLHYTQQCEPAAPAGASAPDAPFQVQTLEEAQASAALRLAEAHQRAHDAQEKLDGFFVPARYQGMAPSDAAKAALAALQTARANFEPYKQTSVQGYRINKDYPSLPAYVYVDTGRYKDDVARNYKKAVDSAWVDYRRVVMWLEMQSELEKAQAEVVQAEQDAARLQDASLSEDTAGTRAALATAEIRAPFEGTVTNLNAKVGETVSPAKPVATVADFSSWVVKTTDLTENDVVHIRVGQRVTLTFDAIPGVTLEGRVLSIGQDYSERQGDIVYTVTVLLADREPGMRWGMTAAVHFPY